MSTVRDKIVKVLDVIMVSLFVYLFVCLFVCLPVYLFVVVYSSSTSRRSVYSPVCGGY